MLKERFSGPRQLRLARAHAGAFAARENDCGKGGVKHFVFPSFGKHPAPALRFLRKLLCGYARIFGKNLLQEVRNGHFQRRFLRVIKLDESADSARH